jgi:RNA polymerase sigma factor for flagellar operon FliA
MKHDQQDHRSFTHARKVAGAYRGDAAERIRRFVPMVRRLAWHVHGGGRPGIELEDLMQAGMVALTECAQRHAGPGEDGFAAYAKLRVRGAMVDLIRRACRCRAGGWNAAASCATRQAALRGNWGARPARRSWPPRWASRPASLPAGRAAEPLRFDSLDEAYSDSDMAFADERPDSLELLAERGNARPRCRRIAALPERLQLIVQLYFVEELNLSEIAETLAVSVPRVHQLKAQALDRLRSALAGIAEVP